MLHLHSLSELLKSQYERKWDDHTQYIGKLFVCIGLIENDSFLLYTLATISEQHSRTTSLCWFHSQISCRFSNVQCEWLCVVACSCAIHKNRYPKTFSSVTVEWMKINTAYFHYIPNGKDFFVFFFFYFYRIQDWIARLSNQLCYRPFDFVLWQFIMIFPILRKKNCCKIYAAQFLHSSKHFL